jgi:hypothetical protein
MIISSEGSIGLVFSGKLQDMIPANKTKIIAFLRMIKDRPMTNPPFKTNVENR